jgi:thiol-disulfide isomerase/thioredoxin
VIRKSFNVKNIVNAVLIMFFIAMVFVPSAKAAVLEGLMKVGFFSPDTSPADETILKDLSGIRFRDVNGKITDLGDLKGRVIFLNFWATWCPPCIAEMPGINKLYEKFKHDPDVAFIMVDSDGNLVKSQKFMMKKKYSLPVHAVASEISEVLFQGSLPTTIVFDKQGRIMYNEAGAANYGNQKFIEFIQRLKTTN